MSSDSISTIAGPKFTIESFESVKSLQWWKDAGTGDALELSTVTRGSGKVAIDRQALKVNYKIRNHGVLGVNKSFNSWEGLNLSPARKITVWAYPVAKNISLTLILERNPGETIKIQAETAGADKWSQLTFDLSRLQPAQRALLKNVKNLIFRIDSKGEGVFYLDQVQASARPLPHKVTTGIFVEPELLNTIPSFQPKPKISTVLTFFPWTKNAKGTGELNPLPLERVKYLLQSGYTPIVTWEPHEIPLADIISGKYDKYITRVANDFKPLKKLFPGGQVALRWGHEMNINPGRYSWCGDPEKYIKAYRHIFNIFEKAGVNDLISWTWTVNAQDADGVNNFEKYYPGNRYVELLAIDGFNWGESMRFDGDHRYWRYFDEIFGLAYNKLLKYNKPISLNEISSHNGEGIRVEWIRDALSQIASPFYPKIVNFNWFNNRAEIMAYHSDQVWQISDYPFDLSAYRQMVGDPAFIYLFPAFPATNAKTQGKGAQ